MRQRRTLLLRGLYTLLYIMVVVGLFTSCTEEKVYRIGVSQCGPGQWREKVNHEMLAAQHLYEQDAKVVIACAYDDTERQIQQIDSLVESGIDLLVVAPNESAPLTEAIKEVRRKGIPVIFFDRKAETDDYTAFIGGSNIKAGRTVGEYALELSRQITNHTPIILEITATMGTSPAKERHEGFAESMKGHSEVDYQCIYSDWSSEEAYRIVKEQLEQSKQPDIVFCHNDGMATGAHKAVEEAELKDKIKILGIDGMPDEGIRYVQEGILQGTYIYPTHGEEIIKLSLDILTGNNFAHDNSMSSMMVTPDNVNIINLSSRELMKQNNDLITIQDKLENSLSLYDTQHKVLIGSFVAIAILVIAVVMACRAYIQTRKAIRQRQALNEEEVRFYTDASNRKIHEIFVKPTEELPPPRSQDILFAEQLNEAIRKNMSNPNLKMDDLGEEMGLSRVQLYRKVKAITGLTPVELLRQMRLQQAYALLTSTTKTVGEIAYEVGFGTPGYFSTCFKKQCGKYPTDLRAE